LSSLSCYDNLWCCRFTPTFRRNKLPSYSGLNDLCPSSDCCDIGGGGGGGVGVLGVVGESYRWFARTVADCDVCVQSN